MATGMHCNASKIIFQYAESLRKNMTEAEKIVWDQLSNNKLEVRIRRQHPLGNYIADFYCHKLKLVIEIDGGIHLSKENKDSDMNRDIMMTEYGIKILRFTNHQVLQNVEKVVEEVKMTIQELKREATPKSPEGGLVNSFYTW